MLENPSYSQKAERKAEKSQTTSPQEEFITPEAVPSKDCNESSKRIANPPANSAK
jgi:hypothetical protein